MSIKEYEGKIFDNDEIRFTMDALTIEEALQININETPFTTTMRTPGNDKSLIRGLLHTEGVLKSSYYIPEINLNKKNCLVTLAEITIPQEEFGEGYAIKRNLLSVSSCGICGRTELNDFNYQGKLQGGGRVDNIFLDKVFEKMKKMQHNFLQSGGTHAAGAVSIIKKSGLGKMLCLMEDIGRHNAVDKVIGELILVDKLDQAHCLIVSGRISYEIIIKCYKANIQFLAAISAPSSLAVDYAKELGITLFAFCRGKKVTCYSHLERTKFKQGKN